MKHHLIAATILCPALLFGAPAHADTILGRWCDRPIPTDAAANAFVTILLKGNGATELVRKFAEGSTLVQRLDEEPGAVFAIRDSTHGDKIRIVASTGNLQFLDNEGFIREATRLANAAGEGDCIP